MRGKGTLQRILPRVAVRFVVAGVLAAACAAEPPAAPPRDEPGWLGVFLGDAPDGGARVVAVVDGGPASKAGIRDGDLLLLVNEKPVTDRQRLREAIRGIRPGEKVALAFLRDGKVEIREIRAEPRVIRLRVPKEPSARLLLGEYPAEDGEGVTLAAIPRELRLFYGAPADAGALVTEVEPESPAAAAGLKVGDVLIGVDGAPVREPGDLRGRLALRNGGAPLALDLVRGGKPLAVSLRGSRDAAEARGRSERIGRIAAEMARLTARIEELQRELDRLTKAP
jgi:S1-C subfamily serine protease